MLVKSSVNLFLVAIVFSLLLERTFDADFILDNIGLYIFGPSLTEKIVFFLGLSFITITFLSKLNSNKLFIKDFSYLFLLKYNNVSIKINIFRYLRNF